MSEQQARLEVKRAVEEWFSDVSLDDLFMVKGWSETPKEASSEEPT